MRFCKAEGFLSKNCKPSIDFETSIVWGRDTFLLYGYISNFRHLLDVLIPYLIFFGSILYTRPSMYEMYWIFYLDTLRKYLPVRQGYTYIPDIIVIYRDILSTWHFEAVFSREGQTSPNTGYLLILLYIRYFMVILSYRYSRTDCKSLSREGETYPLILDIYLIF